MLPGLDLPIIKWEFKELVDRSGDEPKVLDAWVIVWFQTPGGEELEGSFEREPFERLVMPKLVGPSIRFWKDVRVGDPLFPKRAEMLSRLLSQREARERMVGT